jgi:hypothetical protein
MALCVSDSLASLRLAGLATQRASFMGLKMAEYQHHPDYGYGVEIRDGWTEDDYIAQARRFRSTREFIEYRDAEPERQADMRRDRDSREKREDNSEDLYRFVRLAGLI